MDLPFLGADAVYGAVSPSEAVEAIRAALIAGLDPGLDPARISVSVPAGELLLMPAADAGAAGVKVATVAPGNRALGLPRISAVYVLFDAATLAPIAVLDGTALTTLRTPAVAVAPVLPLMRRTGKPLNMVVFGTGPQGIGHVRTVIDCLRGVRRVSITFVVRSAERAAYLRAEQPTAGVVLADSYVAARVLAAADLVVCATSARTPIFDSSLLTDRAIVLAVGSHEPGAREVDSSFAGRAQVVVEDVATALRESGDIVLAIAEGSLTADRLLAMRDVVRDEVSLDPERPVFVKTSGMSWQDLVVAQAVVANT